jgi:hypothetical protein
MKKALESFPEHLEMVFTNQEGREELLLWDQLTPGSQAKVLQELGREPIPPHSDTTSITFLSTNTAPDFNKTVSIRNSTPENPLDNLDALFDHSTKVLFW